MKYEGGITRNFTAVLEEEEDEWRLNKIDIKVPENDLTFP
jgi:hypothetical protein